MPEGSNIEVAHQLTETGDGAPAQKRWHRFVEFAEVAILAVVAVATAWSGFQAAKWDGRQSLRYGQASRDRFAADAASTTAGEELGANAAMFTAWLQAHAAGDVALQTQLANRFTPDYRTAFDAWLALEPFDNPSAPPGPATLPAYRNPFREKADKLNASASDKFDEGTEARDTGEKYVRATVLFASVLFLIALGQRFKAHGARMSVNALAAAVLVYTVVSIADLPRL
jgi:hypothetical protein